ncbi:MAG TPA: hypothetical protein PLF01_05420 [Alphaproteobacteria bacterium]|nr:hypothetical protein [Alphaproteobacteria bacterium]
MDIDLFLSPHGECGLLCNKEFDTPPAGTIFDAETMEMTMEFAQDEPFHLNITVEEELRDRILLARKLYVGFLRDGLIADTIEIPLLYLNDPYGSDFSSQGKLGKPSRSTVAFEQFMKRSTSAQPIHRDDLGDENSNGSVLKGMDPKHLEFVPQLIRQRLLELGPKGPSGPVGPAAPEPSMPSPMGPGGIRSGSGMHRRKMPPAAPPQEESDD